MTIKKETIEEVGQYLKNMSQEEFEKFSDESVKQWGDILDPLIQATQPCLIRADHMRPESKLPSFQDWIKGFESRYTEDQLWHMKWAFEVGVSLALKNKVDI